MTKTKILAAALLIGGAAVLYWVLSVAGVLRDGDAAGAGSRPHVLVITLDTTRWDRLGCTGRRLGDITPTPNLDRLAEEGVLFERAYVSVPLTLPSHTSMFTGLEPPRHGIRENEGFVLPAATDRNFVTMAEILAEHDFVTAAFLGAQPLARGFGLDAGFDVYDDVGSAGGGHHHFNERGADGTTDRALEWLGDLGDVPSLLWVHYFDPHAPYVQHDGHPRRVAEVFEHRYDGEIAFMDAHVGRLLDAYRERGLWDRTLIVVIADHGESLGEHGEATHGLLVHDATIRVPLIIKAPAADDRPLNDRFARSIDLLPTVLDYVGLLDDGATAELDGRSLLDAAPTSAYSETMYPYRQYDWAALRTWIDGDLKIIEGGGRVTLFDLATDPGELRDLAGERPDDVARMTRRLRTYLAGLQPSFKVDTRTDLRGVAYSQVESSTVPAEPSADVNQELPHPAERMIVVAMLDELRAALDGLARDDVESAQESFAAAQFLEGRLATADPASPAVSFWRGRALYLMAAHGGRLGFPGSGRLDMTARAAAAFELVLRSRPRDIRTRNMVLMTHLVRHELGVEGALHELVTAAGAQIGSGLADGLTWALKAKAHEGSGELDEAAKCLREAVELAPERTAFRTDLERIEALRP